MRHLVTQELTNYSACTDHTYLKKKSNKLNKDSNEMSKFDQIN